MSLPLHVSGFLMRAARPSYLVSFLYLVIWRRRRMFMKCCPSGMTLPEGKARTRAKTYPNVTFCTKNLREMALD